MNTILQPETLPRANAVQPGAEASVKRSLASYRREIRDLRRAETARKALEGFDQTVEIYGFTKGQFSIIDLLAALLDQTGPAHLTISTWTAAKSDVSTVFDFLEEGKLTGSKWLVDLTFQRRTPELAQQIRTQFGPDAIRVAQNHAKFSILRNEKWAVFIATSMNLNFNPRFENFLIRNDPAMCDFHESVIAEIWDKQPAKLAHARPAEIQNHFRFDL